MFFLRTNFGKITQHELEILGYICDEIYNYVLYMYERYGIESMWNVSFIDPCTIVNNIPELSLESVRINNG